MDKPSPHKMYFAAIVCIPEIEKKIIQFKYLMRDRYGCVTALRSPAHITLIPPFWLNETIEPVLLARIQSFKRHIGEVQVSLNGFDHFGRRVLFVKVDGNPSMEELKNQLTDHLSSVLGEIIKKEERPFHPHITIANRDLKPNNFLSAWEYFSGKQFKEMFTTNTISLLKLSPGKWNVIAQQTW
jgi:2'-5' RNA ligase